MNGGAESVVQWGSANPKARKDFLAFYFIILHTAKALGLKFVQLHHGHDKLLLVFYSIEHVRYNIRCA